MRTKTHCAIGLLTYTLVTTSFYELDKCFLGFALTPIFSALPDIDITLGIKHRRFTHSLVGLILAGICLVPLILIFNLVAPFLIDFFPWLTILLSYIIGYGSHLLADSITDSGVRWILWPYQLPKYKTLMRYKTSMPIEILIQMVAMLYLSYVFVGEIWRLIA